MVFLFIFLSIIILITIFIIFSKVKIEIKNVKLWGKIPETINISKKYEIIIKLCILNNIPIIKITLTKGKIETLKIKDKVKKANEKALKTIKEDKNKNRKIIKAIKKLNIIIQEMNLKLEIGTENASTTAILVAIISMAISLLLKKHIRNYKNQIFKIQPVYYNQNLVNIEFSGIFEIKMIHIINIIYILNKKEGVKKDERTSNRRTYDYSYE